MVGMFLILVDEVKLTIEPQSLGTLLVEPIFCRFCLFQHNQRGTRYCFHIVSKGTTATKAIYEINLKFVTIWTSIQSVIVSAQIAAKNVQLCLTSGFYLRW